MFSAPEAPRTVMEALTQRLDKYRTSHEAAQAAGEGSKARRMGRIVKVGGGGWEYCRCFVIEFKVRGTSVSNLKKNKVLVTYKLTSSSYLFNCLEQK